MPDFHFPRNPGLGLVLLAGLLCSCTGNDDGEQFSAGLEAGDEIGTDESTTDSGESECGNGQVEMDEQCDLGEANSATGSCTPDCRITQCGDGYVNPDFEECDDGNPADDDDCLSDCTANVCGDGILNVGGEQCDDGNTIQVDDCKNDCTLGTCGDGRVDDGEQCDDGNENQADYCAGCMYATCGDGYTWNGEEECDDGNEVDSDACLSTCVTAKCGDGLLWVGEEACDDGDLDDGDGCPTSCQPASCGDGFVWNGMESCDDGNNVSDDGCDADCYAEHCLQVVNGPEEDLVGDDWFDTCADSPGSLIVVKLADEQGGIVYESQGMMVGDWTQNQLTSAGDSSLEYNENTHDRLVTLDNGDMLFIASKDANPGPDNYYCNTSLGDGYVIVIYPANPNWYINPKMVVTSFDGAFSNQPRKFVNWDEASEISWNGGAPINTCTLGPGGLVPFAGTFTLRVKNP
jgi:cysteine-rich repeat protein